MSMQTSDHNLAFWAGEERADEAERSLLRKERRQIWTFYLTMAALLAASAWIALGWPRFLP
jgi:hypothetical protein